MPTRAPRSSSVAQARAVPPRAARCGGRVPSRSSPISPGRDQKRSRYGAACRPGPAGSRSGSPRSCASGDAASPSSPRPLSGSNWTSSGVDEHVSVGHLAELFHLRVGERRLRWPAPAEQHISIWLWTSASSAYRRCRSWPAPRGCARMRATSTATLPLPTTTARLHRQVELEVTVVGMSVVPGHELGGGLAARQVLAGDAHPAVGLGADRVDHCVVVPRQVVGRDVACRTRRCRRSGTRGAPPSSRRRG